MNQKQSWIQEMLDNFNRFKTGQDSLIQRGNDAVAMIPGDNKAMDAVRAILGAQLQTGTGLIEGGRDIGLGHQALQQAKTPQERTQAFGTMNNAMLKMAPAALELGLPALKAFKGLSVAAKAAPEAEDLAAQIASNPRLRNAMGQYMAKGVKQGHHVVDMIDRSGVSDIASKFKLPNLF